MGITDERAECSYPDLDRRNNSFSHRIKFRTGKLYFIVIEKADIAIFFERLQTFSGERYNRF